MTYSPADFTDDILAKLDITLTDDDVKQDPQAQANLALDAITTLQDNYAEAFSILTTVGMEAALGILPPSPAIKKATAFMTPRTITPDTLVQESHGKSAPWGEPVPWFQYLEQQGDVPEQDAIMLALGVTGVYENGPYSVRIVTEKLTLAIYTDDLDEACRHIQDALGITDGGVAGDYFSCLNDDSDWGKMPHAERAEHLRHYIASEITYAWGA